MPRAMLFTILQVMATQADCLVPMEASKDIEIHLLVRSQHTAQRPFGYARQHLGLQEYMGQIQDSSQLFPDTLSLVTQVWSSRASAALLVLLHVGSPERCTDSVCEGEENAQDGNELEKNGWNSKAGKC
jgi:hypothetical protein